MTNNAQAPAGWYNDPEHPGQQRYWDGMQWTQHVFDQRMQATANGVAQANVAPTLGAGGPAAAKGKRNVWVAVGAVAAVLVFGAMAVASTQGGGSSDGAAPASPAATPSSSQTSAIPYWGYLKSGVTKRSALLAACKPAVHYVNGTSARLARQLQQVAGGQKDPWVAATFVSKVSWLRDGNADQVASGLRSLLTKVLQSRTFAVPTADQTDAYVADVARACGLTAKEATMSNRATRLDSQVSDLKALAESVPWYPKGYREFSDGLAFRWLKSGEYHCASYSINGCFGVSVLSRDGCSSSLYLELTTYDSAGNAVGFTNDTTGALLPGDHAQLVPEVVDDNVSSARVSEITCY